MHKFLLALGALGLVVGALAQPSAWHTIEPEPNPYGWHNTPVTITIEAPGGDDLQACYRLNGAGPFCQTPPVVLHLSSEGIHTVEYWAKDDTGESPHTTITVRIDLTPPVIHIRSPAEDTKYLLHQTATADWFAYDRLSGIDVVDATEESGRPIDTSTPGFQTFWVFAQDRAGNTARKEVDYQVICLIETVLPSGYFLDRVLPPEEQILAGRFTLKAHYVQGESITIAFLLRDALGQAGPWTRPNVLITQVRPDPEFGEKHTIWAWLMIPYDEDAGFYRLVYDTSEREPGIYDLWLGFGDGQSERIRIEILPKS
ncbi:hypothetical protein H5T57_02420 [Candidatus Bipolaricaulota bacterium]|nr:hypothetical protein [Candidatus Bipolaricaulota bacterium]